MPWVKGQSGNPKGKPAKSAAVAIRKILNKRKQNLIVDALNCLEQIEDPLHRFNSIIKLMEFIYPKPKESEIPFEEALERVKREIAERAARLEASGGDSGKALPPAI